MCPGIYEGCIPGPLTCRYREPRIWGAALAAPITQLKSLLGEEIFLKKSTKSLKAYSALQVASWQPTHLQGGQQKALPLLPTDLLKSCFPLSVPSAETLQKLKGGQKELSKPLGYVGQRRLYPQTSETTETGSADTGLPV